MDIRNIINNVTQQYLFLSIFLLYEQNIKISHSIMIKFWTTQCYCYQQGERKFKHFRVPWFSKKFPWVFRVFLDISNFQIIPWFSRFSLGVVNLGTFEIALFRAVNQISELSRYAVINQGFFVDYGHFSCQKFCSRYY